MTEHNVMEKHFRAWVVMYAQHLGQLADDELGVCHLAGIAEHDVVEAVSRRFTGPDITAALAFLQQQGLVNYSGVKRPLMLSKLFAEHMEVMRCLLKLQCYESSQACSCDIASAVHACCGQHCAGIAAKHGFMLYINVSMHAPNTMTLPSLIIAASCSTTNGNAHIGQQILFWLTCAASTPPIAFYLILGLECCQVVDFPQLLPSEALEARQQLSSILQPSASVSTSNSEQVCTLMRHSAEAGGLVVTQEQPSLSLPAKQVTLGC